MVNRYILIILILASIISCRQRIGKSVNGLIPTKNIWTGKYGYSNNDGDIIIEEKYDRTQSFTKTGYAIVRLNNKDALINVRGQEVLPFKYNNIEYLKGDDFRVTEDEKSGVWRKDTLLIPVLYSNIFSLEKDFFLVSNDSKSVGLYNADKLIIPLSYDELKILNNKHLIFRENGKEGILTFGNKEIIPPVYDAIDTILYNKYFIATENAESRLIRLKDNTAIGFGKRSEVIGDLLVLRSRDSNYDIFNLKESERPISTNINYINDKKNLLFITKSGTVSILDKEGRTLIGDTEGLNVVEFSEGKFSFYNYENIKKPDGEIQKIRKYGFLDDGGNILIAPIYDTVNSFSNGKAKVVYNGMSYYIDSSGKCVKDCPSEKWFAHYFKKQYREKEYKSLYFKLDNRFRKDNQGTYMFRREKLDEIGIRFDTQDLDVSQFKNMSIDEIVPSIRECAVESTNILKQNFSDAELINYAYKYIDGEKVIWIKQESNKISPIFNSTIESYFIYIHPNINIITITYNNTKYNSYIVNEFIKSVRIKN